MAAQQSTGRLKHVRAHGVAHETLVRRAALAVYGHMRGEYSVNMKQQMRGSYHNCLLKLIGFCALAGIVAPGFAKTTSTQADHYSSASKAAKPTRVGLASYYGKGFQGKRTANGEVFDKNEMVAAHPTYPMGTQVRVTNLKNGRTLNVRIADRGPTPKHRSQGVIIDLSEKAAAELRFRHQGRTRVSTEVVEWGRGKSS